MPTKNLKRNNREMTNPNEIDATGREKIIRTCQQKCGECKKLASNNGGDEENFMLSCVKCEDKYHMKCMNIKSKFITEQLKKKSFEWVCYNCKVVVLKNVETMAGQMDTLNNTFAQLSQQMLDLNKFTASYEMCVTNLNTRMDMIEKQVNERVATIEARVTTIEASGVPATIPLDLQDVIAQLRLEVENLTAKVNERAEQPREDEKLQKQVDYLAGLQRRNDLIIQGVPHQNNEDQKFLLNTITAIASSCGANVAENDIKTVYRMKLKDNNPESDRKSRPIVVRFNESNTTKENLFVRYLTAVAQGKGPTLGCLTLQPFNKRIYLNHHLSATLMAVKQQALIMKKEGKLDRVTTRYNSIRIKKGDSWHNITSLQQLEGFMSS